MNNEEKKLRPRFIIHKNRISGDESQTTEFSPEKVVYIEIDDEITSVFDRIKRIHDKNIALVIPKRATVLQSVINLKILKKKLDSLEKTIVIVTSDLAGRQLAEKAGICCVERLVNKEECFKAGEKPMPPLGQRPVRISGEKVTISEVIRKGKNEFFLSILERLRKRFRKQKKEASETRLVFIAPNKQALFTLILVSVLLMLAIAYIALPGATIYITPRSTILDPAFNITFLDYEKNRGILDSNISNTITVATFPVRPPLFTKKFKYNSTGKTFIGQNASGIITVKNFSQTPWDLASRTRFQTDNGLVFRIPSAVRVPAARGANPGTLDVRAVADEFDANNQPIGQRGNIPASRFFLPGLRNEENRRKLYGESSAPMAGGETQVIKSVSKADIEASREAVKKDVIKGAADDLKKFLEQDNIAKKRNLSLLTDKNTIEISEPIINAPDNIIGQTMEQFEVTAQYTLAGVAFDRQELTNSLKERLMTRVDPDKKILRVDENDISYRFLEEDRASGKIRLTATMRAIQIYELNPDKENGQRFLKKITDHILGMTTKNALTYIQQQTEEIARVEITLWPIWTPTMPNIADNIKFVIRDENDLQ